MAINNKTVYNDGNKNKKKEEEEKETRKGVSSSVAPVKTGTVKNRRNTATAAATAPVRTGTLNNRQDTATAAAMTPDPAGVLPAAGASAPAKETPSSFETPPQSDEKFREYTARNKAAKYEPKEQTISQAQYDVAHQQWLIDEAKKESNVFARTANKVGQSAANLVGGIADVIDRSFNVAPSGSIREDLTQQLQNSNAGKVNAYIDHKNEVKNEYQQRLDSLSLSKLISDSVNSADFTTYAKYDPNKGNDKDYDPEYEHVNNTYRWKDYYAKAAQTAANSDNAYYIAGDAGNDYIDRMEDQERRVYNYLYNTQGKDKAREYLRLIKNDLEKRRYTELMGEAEEFASDHPVLATAGSTLLNTAAGFTAPAQMLETALNGGRINPYSKINDISNVAKALRSTVGEDIAENHGQGWRFIYDTGVSILDSAARATLGGALGTTQASLIPMALGVYQQTVNEEKLKGRTDEEAIQLGVIAAAAEYLTEMVELDDLFGILDRPPQNWREAISTVIKHSLVEGLEEGESDIINAIGDVLILQDKSEWNKAVSEYEKEGLSHEEAIRRAFIDKAVETGYSTLGGMISGAFMGQGAIWYKALDSSVKGANSRQNRADEQTRASVESARQKLETAQAEAREGADLSSEEWERSRADQSDAAKKRRAALRESAETHGVDEDIIRTMEAISDTTGRNYVWFTKPGNDFGVEDGYYAEKTGDVHINTESAQPLHFVIAHELTHSTEGSAVYKTLREFALSHLAEAGVDVDALRARRKADYEGMDIKDADIDGEIVADYVGRNLLDNAAEIENLVNARHDVAQRVWNWINDRLTRIVGDGSLREKALLTRAQELYGRALAQSRPEKSAAESATAPTAPTTAEAVSSTAPAAEAAAIQQQTVSQSAASQNTAVQNAVPAQAAEELQPPAAGAAVQTKAAVPAQAQTAQVRNTAQGRTQTAERAPETGIPTAESEEEYDESGDEVERMNSLMRSADLTDEEGNSKYSVTKKDIEETREYIESLPEQKKFHVTAAVEKVKTDSGDELIAVHNVKPADFLDTMVRYNGFPAWSLAVIKPWTRHSAFGSVSVIFKKSAADPQADIRNKLYAGDAWTGTFARLTPEEMANADAETVAERIGNTTPRRLNVPTFSSLDEAKASGLLMSESEKAELEREIQKQFEIAGKASRRPDEYMAEATKLLAKGILDATDEEILRIECRSAYDAMKDAQREYDELQREIDSAESNGGEDERRIADLKERAAELYDALGDLERDPFAFDPDKMSADGLRDAISIYLTDELHKVIRGTALDTVNGSGAAEAYRENTAGAAGFINRIFREYEDIALDIVSNYNDIKNSSETTRKAAVEKWIRLSDRYDNGVSYFEAKPARVLGFGEVAGVALPAEDITDDYVAKIRKILDEKGINYEYYGTDSYGSENTSDSRMAVVNRLADEAEGAKFSVTRKVTPEQDEEYLAAARSGDTETAQRMADEAAKAAGAATDENGKVIDLYHGTGRFGFTVFDNNRETASKGLIYATTDPYVAKIYEETEERDRDAGTRGVFENAGNEARMLREQTDEARGGGSYHLYGFPGDKPLVIDAEGESWLFVKAPELFRDDMDHSTDEIANKAKELGYTSAIIRNVRDGGGPADDYIFFDPNQLKSADPVTYDRSGEIIPLSERFNPENNDIRYSITPREQEDVDSLDGGEIVIDDHGDTVADSDGSGHVRFSISTYDASGRALMDAWLKSHVKSGDLTEEDADDIRDSMEKMYSVCREYADKYGSFGAWSEAKVVADEKGNPVFSVVLPNSEYAMNIDFSTICKKRRALNAALNELIDRGVLDDMELDQQSIVKINQILDKHDFEIGCAICFVEAKRFHQASIVDSFVTLYNDMVRSMYPEGTKLGYHDYAGQDMSTDYSDIKPDFTRLNEIMNEYGKKTVEYKTASYLKNNPDARRLLNRSDFMTDRGIMAMRADKTGQRINSLYNSKKGTGGPKSSLGDMQYNHEIIGSRTRTFDRERAYAVGGVRVQSFSDYVAHMVFDYMEMVADLTAKKLPAHSYTKEADYAKLFGLTGMKINMSLVPRYVEGGIAAGLDENGNYAWDKESFDYDLALEIENADGYGDNCGTIAVGVSDEHIRKLLADPNIRMVIPYHRSSLNPIVAEMMHIAAYSDYTEYQRTRGKDGKFLEKEEFNFNKELHDNPNETPQSVAEKYIRWCEDNGYTPKFPQFAYIEHEGAETLNDEGRKAVNPDYYKLLEDFALYDKNGVYHPQGAVRMRFPGENDAFGRYQDLIEDSLRRDNETYERLGNEIPGVADEIIDTLGTGEKENGVKRSVTSRQDQEYMEAVRNGDTETAQRMVDEAAKKAGYNSPKLYHGTNGFGFTKTDTRYSDDGISFFATDSPDTAATYSSNSEIKEIGRRENNIDFNDDRYEYDEESDSYYDTEANTYITPPSHGIYQLYANEDGLLTIDCEGFDWDEIPIMDNDDIYRDYNKWKKGDNVNYKFDVESAFGLTNTRNIAEYAKARKYKGVKFIDVVDNGDYGNPDSSTVYVFFDPQSQVKSADPITYDDNGEIIPLSERFNPENEDIRYSITPVENAEYMKAAEAGDEETAGRMVEEAARKTGHTVHAYHGTREFGFTVFDTRKTDDGISLFATSSPLTAETYSGKTTRNRIKDRATINADDLHGDELIEEAKKRIKSYEDYRLMSDKDKETVREDAKNSIGWSIRRAQEFVRDNRDAFDSDKSAIMDRLISSLYHLRDSETETDISEAWDEWEDAIWDLKGIDDDIALEFLDDVDSRGLLLCKNQLDDMTYQGDMYVDVYPGGQDYIFDQQLQIELNAELHKGIYELYGKPGKQLVIDAANENWNAIIPPQELVDYGLHGPQRTRDIASAAKALNYDSVLFKNLRDNGGETLYNGASDVYIFFDPKQLKSADPITYRDNGEIIPLDERFNPEKDDIRYSITPKAAGGQQDQDTRLEPMAVVENIKSRFAGQPQPESAGQELTDEDRAEMSREAPIRSERELALERAAADAYVRHTNGDIAPPSVTDTEGQKKMFDTQYAAARKFNRAMDKRKLSKTDMALVRDLMAGVKTPEFDYGEAQNPGGVQEVFETLVEADRANRTVEAYKDAIHDDLTNTARGKLENVDSFKDKRAGILYARETQERNIRDIAPGADAEAIIAEYFDPVHVHTMQAKQLSDEYSRRVNKLKIDTKRRHGNKNSENEAIQLIGEVESIISELEEKTAAYNKRVENQSQKSHSRYRGADAALQKGLGSDPYARQPRKYGMTLDEYREILEKFKKDNPNLNYDEIHRKIGEMQKIYGELYDRLNEVYMRWGYPPMGKIKNYFPHFMAHEDGILNKIAGVLGFDQSAQGLPAYLAGLTKDFKPGRQWFANALRRMTNYTEYDTLRGFERYIQKAADIIYHTEDIQKLRAYANTIRYLSTDAAMEDKIRSIRNNKTLSEDEKQIAIGALYSNKAMTKYNLANYVQNVDEYINTELANKRSSADRWLEENFGRSFIYGAVKSYQRLRVRSAVQGNITSALTNIIPIAQVSGVAGLGNTAAAYLQTVGNMVRTMFGGHDTLRENSVFLQNRQDYESVIPKNMLNRLGDLASLPFAIMDRLGSETTWRALYNYNRRHGMSQETASALADKRAADIVADRSKGALPTLFMAHNPLVNMFTRFMVEQNNTVSYLTKDVPRYFQGRKLRTGLAYAIIAMMSWLFNEGFEALFGRRPAQDLLGIVNDLAGDISGYKAPNVFRKGGELISEGRFPTAEDFETDKNTVLGTVKNTAGNVIDQAPFSGMVGTLLDFAGIDLDLQGGRFEMSDIGPDIPRIINVAKNEAPEENLRQVLAEELSKPVTGLMPAGNQIQKTVKGVSTMLAGGSYKINDKGERLLQYPAEKNPGNWARAAFGGKSALPTAQEWVQNGFDTLNAKDTALYDNMTGVYNVKPEEALDLIKGLNDVKKTDDESKAEQQRRMLIDSKVNQDSKLPVYQAKGLSTASEDKVIADLGPENINKLLKTFDQLRRNSKGYQKRDILRSSGLSRDTKESIYTNMIDKDDGEKIDAALKTGLSFDDWLDIAYKYKSINNEDKSAGEKATEFAKWLDEQPYTDEQRSAIKESNKYWQSIPAQASGYEKLTGAGLSSDQAYDLYEQLDSLEPLTGAKSVSHAQKWDVIINSGLSTSEQLDVIKAVSYDGEYYDFKISNDYGVDPKRYKEFLDSMPKYDADGNGSYKQAEIQAALDAATGLTNKQKAAIWQLNGSSTTAKNNPYSKDVGNYVLQLLKDMKAQTEKEKAAKSASASASASVSAALTPPTATVSGTTASGTSSSASAGSGQAIAYTPNLGLPRG